MGTVDFVPAGDQTVALAGEVVITQHWLPPGENDLTPPRWVLTGLTLDSPVAPVSMTPRLISVNLAWRDGTAIYACVARTLERWRIPLYPPISASTRDEIVTTITLLADGEREERRIVF